jgi:hypothetical protein
MNLNKSIRQEILQAAIKHAGFPKELAKLEKETADMAETIRIAFLGGPTQLKLLEQQADDIAIKLNDELKIIWDGHLPFSKRHYIAITKYNENGTRNGRLEFQYSGRLDLTEHEWEQLYRYDPKGDWELSTYARNGAEYKYAPRCGQQASKTLDPKIIKKAEKLYDKCVAFFRRRREAEMELKTMLDSIRTSKQLIELYPEFETFIPKITKSFLPSVRNPKIVNLIK